MIIHCNLTTLKIILTFKYTLYFKHELKLGTDYFNKLQTIIIQ